MSRTKTTNKSSNASRGKPRFRKKALHAAILKQMEFYFSDANLCKDRFLSNLIKQDPYVDLNVFISFNKIQELTTSPERIAKALQGSTMLALSEDGNKVRRITPIVKRENVDECTIYVQNLPFDADHETLITVFSHYGKVVYVSVPRYKSNKKIKGFAFVEFDTPQEAQKCLECFQSKGCVLPLHTSPDDLFSITTFDNAEKDVRQGGRPKQQQNDAYDHIQNTEEDMELNDEENIDNENLENAAKDTCQNNEAVKLEESSKKTKSSKKRRHEETEPNAGDNPNTETTKVVQDTDVIQCKKKKYKHSQDVGSGEVTGNDEDSSKFNEEKEEEMKEDCHGADDLQNEQNADVEMNNTGSQEDMGEEKKKKRKRTRRSKEDISNSMGLQIMAKKDWKYLRNKYLELQRSKMKQLKQHLKKARWNQWSNYEKNKTEKEEIEEKEKISKENDSTARFSFTPGVIVKVEMNQPCANPKGFKMELKGNSAIKYIDVEEGSFHAYIRCDTPEAAQALVQKSDDERQMTILQDKEERMYWDKISQDRADKLGKKVRVKQRGRDKLLKKAEKELGKHIKFDEV